MALCLWSSSARASSLTANGGGGTTTAAWRKLGRGDGVVVEDDGVAMGGGGVGSCVCSFVSARISTCDVRVLFDVVADGEGWGGERRRRK